ncbi:MAG: SDR family NAD(P)-dependent oxidoreductase [Ilumatobacter sp.]|uniref:SDR family NAD(P)-dependent oxidoreductase n=1 Tax=Ilumatobacter sp. TaxID=1967498 RepID=UPI00261B46D6|nr:SDR family NAD(P)-dependent oxidoreductase [Ilumatobacter sp.]MDJ0767538.1 SDR family NAD(P)-dependent oxidoreductase [Ilumatobacter sp.]
MTERTHPDDTTTPADTNRTTRTALVTGATSGLGFEAAAQLPDAGFDRVIVTGRSRDRALMAAEQLVERTGRPVFEPLALDLNAPTSVQQAADELVERGVMIDYLLLNAGMVSGNDQVITDAGVEVTFSSSLIGHHQLTMRLLADERLSPTARIVISGSEAARDDVPTFSVVDVHELARKEYGGDATAASVALILGEQPAKFKPGDVYATTKMFVAWWAAALARRLPAGITVNAISPGSAPDTNAIRNANFFMRKIMVPAFKHAPKRMGMAAPVPVAATRYLQPLEWGPDVNGRFFASAPKKMTGPIEVMQQPHVLDTDAQEAGWAATVHVAGADVPAAV